MIITELVNRIPVLEIHGDNSREITELVIDSRKVTEGSLYVAIRGTVVDGHSFITSAIEKGAAAVVCEELPETLAENVTYILVKDSSKALGHLASNYYGNPSQKLKLIGVTGTNGKTSVSTLLFDVFKNLGYPAALLSTVEIRIGEEIIPATHTTPDVITINRILAEAVEKGYEFAFMEVSSHGIAQNRIEGLHFKIAGFTNLTHDHLDYHKTFEEYLKTKKRFFDELEDTAIAITNVDDKNGNVMLQNTKAKKKSYALKTMADYHGKLLEVDFNGMLLNFNGKEFWTTLTGKFNVYNLLLVFGIAAELGFEQDEILQAISKLKRVSGRFETFKSDGGIFFIVDYAHTPDALENVLKTIENIRTRNEQVITVVGCGGDRDALKRPEMARIACELSDKVILTSDNPRTEDPAEILRQMEAGVEAHQSMKVLSILDRDQAIKTAVSLAQPKDIILIAGKGHEKYQDIKGVKYPFDDFEVVKNYFKKLNK